MARKHWLMKSEPDTYSFQDLVHDGRTHWEGVRNYQARNLMRSMAVGDLVLFYHSQMKPPGVVGIAEVVKEAYDDFTAQDPKSPYFDAKATPDNPRWSMVDLAPVRPLESMVSLADLKDNPKLESMAVVRKGQRLSVQPVTAEEYQEVLVMAACGGEQDAE
ncbi:MAG: EVE domain-containing protein [Thermoanaerobaculia bacterium]|nr:EVE domain-containing protein [Thermoanaerobaculia bacterium]